MSKKRPRTTDADSRPPSATVTEAASDDAVVEAAPSRREPTKRDRLDDESLAALDAEVAQLAEEVVQAGVDERDLQADLAARADAQVEATLRAESPVEGEETSADADWELAAEQRFHAGEDSALPADAPGGDEHEPTLATPVPGEGLKGVLEALLFVMPEPVSAARLSRLVGGVAIGEITRMLRQLQREYEDTGRAFGIVEIAHGWQILTRPQYAAWLEKLRKVRQEAKITPAGLHTLSIVAYKQPITRAEVDVIRGADSGPHLRQLLDRGLVRIAGRKKVPGSPLMYGTTTRFLQQFGLKSIKDLPQSSEFRDDAEPKAG